MKASPWEKEDAQHEDIPIIDNHVPKSFVIEYEDGGDAEMGGRGDAEAGKAETRPVGSVSDGSEVTQPKRKGRLKGVMFEKVEAVYDENGKRSLVPTGEPEVFFPADDVLVAIGQENSFPWIERNIGLDFDKWEMPIVDKTTFQSTNPKVFFGGDAAFGPENVITAVAHGHQAAVSIDLLLQQKESADRATRSDGESRLAEDGHPRMGVRQRDRRIRSSGRAAGTEDEDARQS